MNNYKVSISATPGWQDYSLCSLDISIGNDLEVGEKLEATVNWISNRFEHCIINLGDALCRHSLKGNICNSDEHFKKAVALGDQWLDQNNLILKSFQIPYTVTRWDEWLRHKEFNQIHGEIWGKYFQSKSFRNAVKEDVIAFIKRNEVNGKKFSSVEKNNCLNYIMEEMAVHTIMSKEFKFARTYTARRLKTALYMAENNIGMEDEAYIKLNFKRRKTIIQKAA